MLLPLRAVQYPPLFLSFFALVSEPLLSEPCVSAQFQASWPSTRSSIPTNCSFCNEQAGWHDEWQSSSSKQSILCRFWCHRTFATVHKHNTLDGGWRSPDLRTSIKSSNLIACGKHQRFDSTACCPSRTPILPKKIRSVNRTEFPLTYHGGGNEANFATRQTSLKNGWSK